MKNLAYDSIDSLKAIKNTDDLVIGLTKIAQDLGFEYCGYGLRFPTPITSPRIAMANNYPTQWSTIYRQNQYHRIDPSVLYCNRSIEPIIWSDRLFEKAQDLWEEARSHGLHHGWSQSCFDCDGTASMLSFSRSSERMSDAEVAEKKMKMAWITQTTHLCLRPHITHQLPEHTSAKLTAREIEVLRWTADGKISADIATILNLSERTVNFHINNAAAKLNVPNKTAATIKAALTGVL